MTLTSQQGPSEQHPTSGKCDRSDHQLWQNCSYHILVCTLQGVKGYHNSPIIRGNYPQLVLQDHRMPDDRLFHVITNLLKNFHRILQSDRQISCMISQAQKISIYWQHTSGHTTYIYHSCSFPVSSRRRPSEPVAKRSGMRTCLLQTLHHPFQVCIIFAIDHPHHTQSTLWHQIYAAIDVSTIRVDAQTWIPALSFADVNLTMVNLFQLSVQQALVLCIKHH